MRCAILLGLLLLLACSGGDDASGGAPESAPGDGSTTDAASHTSPSGLVMTTLVEGTGPSPTSDDVVEVHYHGTFEDGRVFDSSVERGQPARFPLNRVIPCWTEGVARMKVGGKAKLVCPPEIAYGARGAPGRIPPNSTLSFEVELIGIH